MKIGLLIVSILNFLQEEKDTVDLGPILEPDPVVFTFETIGWYILVVVLFLVCVFFGVKFIIKYHRNAYRRDALKKLEILNVEVLQNHAQVNRMNVLLKQVGILTYGRERVAAIYGDEWFNFLENTSKKTKFTKYSKVISSAIYESENVTKNDYEAIFQLTKNWIKTHA